MPVSGQTLLGMAAATGELQLYMLADSQVRNVASSFLIIYNKHIADDEQNQHMKLLAGHMIIVCIHEHPNFVVVVENNNNNNKKPIA